MSDSNRGERSEAVGRGFAVLAAIILVALIVGQLAYASGVEGERRDNTPANYAHSGKQHAIETCVDGDPVALVECAYETAETSYEQANAEQDLSTQQGMKFWAAVMAWLTGTAVVVTTVGVWYVKRTLDTNSEFLKETKSATEAMVRQNELAEASQRPWLDFAPGENGHIVITHDAIRLIMSVPITNEGKNPAANAQGRIWAFLDGDPPSDLINLAEELFDSPSETPHLELIYHGKTKLITCDGRVPTKGVKVSPIKVVIAIRYVDPLAPKYRYVVKSFDTNFSEAKVRMYGMEEAGLLIETPPNTRRGMRFTLFENQASETALT